MPPTAQLLAQAHRDVCQGSDPARYCASHLEAVKDIVVFFALNVVAHAFTVPAKAGQKLLQTVGMAFFMIVSPVFVRSGYTHTFGKIWYLWCKRNSRSWLMWLLLGPLAVFWTARREGELRLQAAIDAGAVAIPFDPEYSEMQHWTQLDLKSTMHMRDAVYEDGLHVGTHVDLRYVPPGTTAKRGLNVLPSSSALQAIIAMFQLCYSSFELFSSSGAHPQASAKALSSPFIIVIPYVVMSFVNLVFNLCVGTYPCVTVLRPTARPQNRETEISYVVEGLDPSNDDSEPASSAARLLPSKSGHPKRHRPSQDWLLDRYSLKPQSSEEPIYHGEWLTWSMPISLLACYSVITLLLFLVTRMQVSDPLLAVSFLFWIYSGIVHYISMLLLAGIDVLSRHYFSNFFGARTGATVFVCAAAVLAGVGPLCPGVYSAVRELWKYYSACTPPAGAPAS